MHSSRQEIERNISGAGDLLKCCEATMVTIKTVQTDWMDEFKQAIVKASFWQRNH